MHIWVSWPSVSTGLFFPSSLIDHFLLAPFVYEKVLLIFFIMHVSNTLPVVYTRNANLSEQNFDSYLISHSFAGQRAIIAVNKLGNNKFEII